MTLAFNIIAAFGSIGTFVAMLITLSRLIKAAAKIGFKPEKLYGKEAEDRYAATRNNPHKNAVTFGPDEYRGGNRSLPQFEVERFYFDKDTMPAQWKNFTKTVRYFYEENGKTMVCGWRS